MIFDEQVFPFSPNDQNLTNNSQSLAVTVYADEEAWNFPECHTNDNLCELAAEKPSVAKDTLEPSTQFKFDECLDGLNNEIPSRGDDVHSCTEVVNDPANDHLLIGNEISTGRNHIQSNHEDTKAPEVASSSISPQSQVTPDLISIDELYVELPFDITANENINVQGTILTQQQILQSPSSTSIGTNATNHHQMITRSKSKESSQPDKDIHNKSLMTLEEPRGYKTTLKLP